MKKNAFIILYITSRTCNNLSRQKQQILSLEKHSISSTTKYFNTWSNLVKGMLKNKDTTPLARKSSTIWLQIITMLGSTCIYVEIIHLNHSLSLFQLAKFWHSSKAINYGLTYQLSIGTLPEFFYLVATQTRERFRDLDSLSRLDHNQEQYNKYLDIFRIQSKQKFWRWHSQNRYFVF